MDEQILKRSVEIETVGAVEVGICDDLVYMRLTDQQHVYLQPEAALKVAALLNNKVKTIKERK